ncbi:MAG: hypothetical protein U1A78_37435 [Polyangia bacterium]
MLPEIDKAVRELVREHVGSVIELEVLLLVSRSPARGHTAAEVARELRVSDEWTQGYLSKLCAKGILRERPGRPPVYAFAPSSPSIHGAVSRLAQAYAQQRHTVIDLIYSEPDDEILTFADAFKLWKGRGSGIDSS